MDLFILSFFIVFNWNNGAFKFNKLMNSTDILHKIAYNKINTPIERMKFMSKPILFYSSVCPDTDPFIKLLEPYHIEYEAINITETMPNLKRFLSLRDTRKEFMEKKELYQVGIPVLVTEDATLIFDEASLNDYYKET